MIIREEVAPDNIPRWPTMLMQPMAVARLVEGAEKELPIHAKLVLEALVTPEIMMFE